MLNSLFRYLQGYLKICVTGYSPERFLNLCKNKKIAIWGLEPANNHYEMYMKISGFRKLKPILKKTHTKVSIKERYGMPFFFHKYRKRKAFFIGIIGSVIFIYSLSFFVWNIDFEGNHTITNNVLLEYLSSNNIKHGMAKSKVDCQKIARQLRENFGDIIWVSASMEGTRLLIHVKENTDTFKTEATDNSPCDIVTDKAGVVVSVVTRSGVPKVKEGDAVQAGDVLVSGAVEILNDAKEVERKEYVVSDADIILKTDLTYKEDLPKTYQEKQYTGKKRRVFYVKIGKQTISLGIRKNKFQKSDIKTTEMQVKLDENFYLPIFVGTEEILEYEMQTKEYKKEQIKELWNEKFQLFCEKLKEKNITIVEQNPNLTISKTKASGTCLFTLLEEVNTKRKIVDL